MASTKTTKATPRAAGKPDKWFEPEKPDFIKLEVGEVLTGVYLGRQKSQYGPTYRFQTDKDKVQVISRNRASIDGLMDQVDAAGMKGHLLTVERRPDEKSSAGRMVHQYRIGHIPQDCPGCAK